MADKYDKVNAELIEMGLEPILDDGGVKVLNEHNIPEEVTGLKNGIVFIDPQVGEPHDFRVKVTQVGRSTRNYAFTVRLDDTATVQHIERFPDIEHLKQPAVNFVKKNVVQLRRAATECESWTKANWKTFYKTLIPLKRGK